MFTLQIRDRGQTFLQPLDGPLAIGSAADAGLRLHEPAVAPRHARIDIDGDKVTITAVGTAPLGINGRSCKRALLQLGDRIELGGAVLVVGRSIVRPAGPDDVLADAGSSRSARRRAEPVPPWVIATGVVCALAMACFLFTRGGSEHVSVAHIAELRRVGDFAGARQEVARLRQLAAGDRVTSAWIDAEVDTLEAVARAYELKREAILGNPARTLDEWQQALQRQRSLTAEPVTNEVAKLLQAQLPELLASRPAMPVADPDAAAMPATASLLAAGGGAAEARSPDPSPAARNEAAATVAAALHDAEQMLADGRFGPASDTLQAALEQVSVTQAEPLRQQLARVHAQAQAALAELLQRVHEQSARGELGPALAQLTEQQLDLQARRGATTAPLATPAGDEQVRRATLEELRSLMEQVRAAETAGDFGTVARLQRQGAFAVAGRDPEFAARLRLRAGDAELLATLHAETVAFAQAGGKVELTLTDGRSGSLGGADGCKLVLRCADGEQRASWNDVAPAGLPALTATGKLSVHALLGAAVLAQRSGDDAVAEAILVRLLKAEPKAKPEIDQVLARGRGERIDGRGYVLEKGRLVSARSIDARKDAGRLLQQLETVLRSKEQKVRDGFVTELLAKGPDALEPVLLAFKQELRRQVEALGKSSLKKQVDRLLAQRQLLDAARQHALELIYDEVKYFYPYRPPAVSPEQAAEYARVQAEVDRRVAAVRVLWNDDTLKIKVPASLQDDLQRLDFVAGALSDLGELDATSLAEIEWARALPPGDKVDVHNFCRTPAERAELEQWARVEAFDGKVEDRLEVVEREQLHVTNAYRAMFRHRPLAVNLKLHTSARGHAEEMSKLGYFAHFSPTPGRRTPFDRMKLAGYESGVSENIALNDSAPAAHDAWCHSSGHHRNLLNAQHTEFGIGALGRYWVQNFGQGREYEADPAFKRPR